MHTILLIEDNAELLDNTAEILELANYKVVKAGNGKEGLEKAKQHSDIAMILCDIMMPELDGYGVLRGVENNPAFKSVPFIFLTAKSEKNDVRKGMDLGADDYLIKPFTGDELLSLITARLKKSQALKEAGNNNGREFEQLLSNPQAFVKSELFKNKFHVKKMNKRETLYMEGDKSFYLYYVMKGKVKASKTNDLGKDYIVNIFTEGDFLGHSALLDKGLHEDSAITMEDAEIAMLSKSDFMDIVANNTEVCVKFMKHISSLLNQTENQLPKLAYNSARKKVAEALIYVAKKYNSECGDNTSFPATRDDLSAISGISPESVSRNLTDFKEEGLIGVKNGELVILNFKKLDTLKN